MDAVRYYVALLVLIALPPGLFLWFAIHPFVRFWRKFGPGWTYAILALPVAGMMIGIYGARQYLLAADLGTRIPLIILGALCFVAGILLFLKRRKQLTARILVGLQELSPPGKPEKLLTEGIYSRIRHPRYVEIAFCTLAYALIANFLAVYILFILTLPTIYLIVLLEERELRDRFGEAYETYCRRVPRFVPRFVHRNAAIASHGGATEIESRGEERVTDDKERVMTFEIDHLFVAVVPGAPEVDRLLARGFREGPPNTHPGQGTACRGIFFEKVYLEFIWLVNPVEASSAAIRRTRLGERLNLINSSCPFGICIRSAGQDGPADLVQPAPPFATWDYAPPYLPEGRSIPIGVNADRLDEPLLFFLPWSGRAGEASAHPNGARIITGVSITFPAAGPPSQELAAFSKLGLVKVSSGPEPLLHVELDNGKEGASIDLRPDAPLMICW